MPATFELLDAVNLRDVRTTAEVATRLGVEEREAGGQLREAEREGLVQRDIDLSASLSDDEREFWMLTPEGRAVWDGLDARRSQ